MISFPIKNQSISELIRQAFSPAAFARTTLKFQPDPTQDRVLENIPRRLILNCNRQWGKSTVSAILLAHRAIFQSQSFSIILGPSERQSAETLRKVAGFLHDAQVKFVSDKVNRRSLYLPANGLRIVALPSSDGKVRGFSKVNLLVIDEASRVPDSLYYALRPSLAVSHGDVVLVSTPFGKRGFFYTDFHNTADQSWERYTVPASQCPRIPAAFLEQERAIGDEYYAQEYDCQFIEDGRFLFSDADFTRLFKSDIDPLRIHDRTSPAWHIAMQPVPVPVPRYEREE